MRFFGRSFGGSLQDLLVVRKNKYHFVGGIVLTLLLGKSRNYEEPMGRLPLYR